MLSLGGAVIPMQTNLDKITYLVGDEEILLSAPNTPALPMFSDKVMEFMASLSREILKDKRTRLNVDVTSYAYWIRKASLESAKGRHSDYRNRLGRGVAFHVAPSNVPVNFAVSMTSSILAGNITIIRVSNKQFEQVDIICDAMNSLLNDEYAEMKPYFCLVRYEHNDEITQFLSDICDIRIIWGGNQTIETIRSANLPPRSIEMTFADRHSLAVINADYYLQQDEGIVAKRFYTDTYYTDQNACSSPRLVVWTGEKIEEARNKFWNAINELVITEYDMKPIQAVDKYTSMCMLGMAYEGVSFIADNNFVTRIEVETLFPELMNYKNGGGYFFEYCATHLEEIVPVLTKQCQTISILGIGKDEIKDIVFKYGVRGVDRIVPLGETMGLEFIWDGYKMIENMTRFVYTGDYL